MQKINQKMNRQFKLSTFKLPFKLGILKRTARPKWVNAALFATLLIFTLQTFGFEGLRFSKRSEFKEAPHPEIHNSTLNYLEQELALDPSELEAFCEERINMLQDTTLEFTYQQLLVIDNCLREYYNDSLKFYTAFNQIGLRNSCYNSSDYRATYISYAEHIYTDQHEREIYTLLPFYMEDNDNPENDAKNTTIFEEVGFNFSEYDGEGTLKAIVDGQPFDLSNGEFFWEANLSNPRNVTIYLSLLREDPDFEFRSGHLSFRVKSNPNSDEYRYIQPDDIWYIVGAPFDPGEAFCENAYLEEGDKRIAEAGAYVSVLYANPDKILRKPLVFLDGLDMSSNKKCDPDLPFNHKIIRSGSLGYDTFITGLFENTNTTDILALSPRLIEQLKNEGYDVLFVDFEDGATWIQANGECVISILEDINSRKQGEEQSIVVGASMGGQIAKWALSKMEERDINHCASAYVSFDSPQKGATIPLGLQALLFQQSLLGNSPRNQKAWQGINRPAPQQLLLHHLNNAFGDTDGCIRKLFVEEMKELGYPKKVKNIGIACASGTGNGVLEGNNPGLNLFETKVEESGCTMMHVAINTSYGKHQTVHHNPNCSSPENRDDIVFTSKIPTAFYSRISLGKEFEFMTLTKTGENQMTLQRRKKFPTIGGWENAESQDYVFNIPSPDVEFIDMAPGCLRQDLKDVVRPMFLTSDPRVVVMNFQPATFMPITSLLDIDTESLYFDVAGNIQKTQPDPSLTPFDMVYYTEGQNLAHVEITDDIIEFVMENVIDRVSQPSVLTSRFNYAHPSQKTIPSTEILAGGELVINGAGNAGFGEIELKDKSHLFKINTGGCEDVVINIKDGGKLILGELLEFKSAMLVNKNHELNIFKNGYLAVENESSLVINNGSKLWIEEGSLIYVKNKGEIILEGEIEVSGNARIKADGPIHILPGASITGNGVLHIDGAYGNNPDIQSKILDIHPDVQLVIGETPLIVSGGAIAMRPQAGIVVDRNGFIKLEDCLVFGADQKGNIPQFNEAVALSATDFDDVEIDNTTFTMFHRVIDLQLSLFNPQKTVRFEGLRIINCNQGIKSKNIGNLRLHNSAIAKLFVQNDESPVNDLQTGIWLQSSNLHAINTSISDYTNGYGIFAPNESEGINSWKNNIMLTHCSSISNCMVGIRIDGGIGNTAGTSDWGLMHMSASSLAGNMNRGVMGTDVLLSIDAINHPGQKPNNFDMCQGGGGRTIPDPGDISGCLVFDICFINRLVDEVPARGNYWGTDFGFDGRPVIRYELNKGNSINQCFIRVPLDEDYFWRTLPPNSEGDCSMGGSDTQLDNGPVFGKKAAQCTDGGGIEADRVFSDAYTLQIEGFYSDAKAEWSLISGEAPLDTCGYYQQFAAIFSPKNQIVFEQRLNDIKETKSNISVFPNPASETLYIQIPEGKWELLLTDPTGKVFISQHVRNSTEELNISKLSPGMYIIQIISLEENTKQFFYQKLIKK